LKGETLKSIAIKYKSDADEILSFNGIEDSSRLVVGSSIIIPDGEIKTPVPSSSGIRTTSPLRGVGGALYEGYYIRPVVNAKKTQGLHGYNGVDFGATTGTPVIAAASGTVIVTKFGGYNGGYGNYIAISHRNGTQTLYAHLSSVLVVQGQYVTEGDVIGKIGSTGRSTGPHLHFEVRGAVNPF
jgi:murein DD-endopeptidase MepM/ murein hydrolase activator NlpD